MPVLMAVSSAVYPLLRVRDISVSFVLRCTVTGAGAVGVVFAIFFLSLCFNFRLILVISCLLSVGRGVCSRRGWLPGALW